MESSKEAPDRKQDRPSFFGRPASFALWSGVGQRFWGGLLCGIGLGMFVAKFLQDWNAWSSSWVGFAAICMIGGGAGLALRAVRALQLKENQARNS